MIIYVVQPGDTLNSIAAQYGTTAAILQSQNWLPNPDRLIVGQTIVILGDSTPLREASINGYAYPFINNATLLAALPSLSRLTIFGYGFNLQGDLFPIDDSPLIKLSYDYNVAPVMLLSTITEFSTFDSNHASIMLNRPELQDVLIDNIIITMEEKGYLGLDLDFEFVNLEDKEGYIGFIEKLVARLNPLNYFVNVDLAPKTSANQQGLLYESHDYERIGAIANYVLVMTYEWGYTYSVPMAVAPIDKVRQVLDYAVSAIPLEKIYMGIPNYGYDWPLPYVKGVTRARTIGNNEAYVIAGRYNAQIMFDETAMTPYFNYTDYDGVYHEVWFEDARSIDAKLRLIEFYGIKGAGYWNLMRDFPQNFLVLNSLYNIEKI